MYGFCSLKSVLAKKTPRLRKLQETLQARIVPYIHVGQHSTDLHICDTPAVCSGSWFWGPWTTDQENAAKQVRRSTHHARFDYGQPTWFSRAKKRISIFDNESSSSIDHGQFARNGRLYDWLYGDGAQFVCAHRMT